MCAVLDDVACRHGGQAKAVHEDGLKLAFDKVQREETNDKGLQIRGRRERLLKIEVDVWPQDI